MINYKLKFLKYKLKLKKLNSTQKAGSSYHQVTQKRRQRPTYQICNDMLNTIISTETIKLEEIGQINIKIQQLNKELTIENSYTPVNNLKVSNLIEKIKMLQKYILTLNKILKQIKLDIQYWTIRLKNINEEWEEYHLNMNSLYAINEKHIEGIKVIDLL